MLSSPTVAEPLLSQFAAAFAKPTFQRAMVLFVGFVLTAGRHTVTRTLLLAEQQHGLARRRCRASATARAAARSLRGSCPFRPGSGRVSSVTLMPRNMQSTMRCQRTFGQLLRPS